MSDKTYMVDPAAKSVSAFIEGVKILSRHMKEGLETRFFMGAEHDVIYVYVDPESLPEDSANGQRLSALGFHVENDSWAYFT